MGKSTPLRFVVNLFRWQIIFYKASKFCSVQAPFLNTYNDKSFFYSAFVDSTYGFANRVAEGMSLYVNSVEINFDSGVFRGSLTVGYLNSFLLVPLWNQKYIAKTGTQLINNSKQCNHFAAFEVSC